MRTVHVLQHVELEGPGRIAEIARGAGFEVQVHRVCDGSPVPDSIPSGDALVVMGGAMGVGDLDDARWPFLRQEVSLLERTLGEAQPVLGVCLGAQLMAHALGARVFPLVVGHPPVRHREVGWGAVTFAASPESEPVFRGLDASEVTLHWHRDTFDLPRGGVHLASTLACQNQMFRWGRHAFAVQFHPELVPGDVIGWVRDDVEFVTAANGPGGPARIIAETDRFAERYRRSGDRLLRNLIEIWRDTP
jgi:GMP synthase-like glutamine amidotransferase